MIAAMEWKSFLVVYEESEGLVRLQEVLKMAPKKKKDDLKIKIRQLKKAPKTDSDDNRVPPDYRFGNSDYALTCGSHLICLTIFPQMLSCGSHNIQYPL